MRLLGGCITWIVGYFCFQSILINVVGAFLLHRRGLNLPQGPYYWVMMACISVVAGFGSLPLHLRAWYDARGLPTRTSGLLSGCCWLFWIVSWITVVGKTGATLLLHPNLTAQIFPFRWATVQGRVLDTQLPVQTPQGLYPYIVYSYTVDGLRYHSNQITFAGNGTGLVPYSMSSMWNLQREAPVTVYYDPAHPRLAALAPRLGATYPRQLIVQGVLFVLIIMLVMGIDWNSYHDASNQKAIDEET